MRPLPLLLFIPFEKQVCLIFIGSSENSQSALLLAHNQITAYCFSQPKQGTYLIWLHCVFHFFVKQIVYLQVLV